MGSVHSGQIGGAALFYEWHYLIFILPFAVGAFLLLLSSLRIGGHARTGHHVGHELGHSGAGHGHTSAPRPAPGTSQGQSPHTGHPNATNRTTKGARTAAGPTPLTISMLLFGIGRAPLPLVTEFFLICYGLVGLWAVQRFVSAPHPNLLQMIPSIAVAFGGGWAGSRGAAELVGRLLPQDETAVVSGDALFGLTGKVTYPITERSGRAHIYDDFGTLHDEMCCVPDGYPTITRGSTVRIVDRDKTSGRLLVECVSPPVGKEISSSVC